MSTLSNKEFIDSLEAQADSASISHRRRPTQKDRKFTKREQRREEARHVIIGVPATPVVEEVIAQPEPSPEVTVVEIPAPVETPQPVIQKEEPMNIQQPTPGPEDAIKTVMSEAIAEAIAPKEPVAPTETAEEPKKADKIDLSQNPLRSFEKETYWTLIKSIPDAFLGKGSDNNRFNQIDVLMNQEANPSIRQSIIPAFFLKIQNQLPILLETEFNDTGVYLNYQAGIGNRNDITFSCTREDDTVEGNRVLKVKWDICPSTVFFKDYVGTDVKETASLTVDQFLVALGEVYTQRAVALAMFAVEASNAAAQAKRTADASKEVK